jgi:ABC-type multidrug transport system fused ATPase/permease subunit
VQDAIGSTAAVFMLMDRRPRMKVRADLQTNPLRTSAPSESAVYDYSELGQGCPGKVVFRNVSFAYPLRGGVPVLRDINLTIRPGQRTAIVGGRSLPRSAARRIHCQTSER